MPNPEVVIILSVKLDTVTSNVRKTVTTSLFNWDVGHVDQRITFSKYAQLTEDQRKFLMRRILPTYRLIPRVKPNYPTVYQTQNFTTY